jgi:uncharacterized protein (DUF1697 family)
MYRYIALLRGINVGGHIIKMDRLRMIFSDLGCKNVRSYIHSGNLFFDTDDAPRELLTSTIEERLHQELGYPVPTFLRSIGEVEAMVLQAPFEKIEVTADKRFCVMFTKQLLNTKLALPQHSSKNDMDLVAIGNYEAYVVWHIINGRPPSGKFLASVIPVENTTRFYHTLVKILAAAKSD